MFTSQDLVDFKERNISIEKVEKQIEQFKKGFPYIKLNRPATINDGILKMNENDINDGIDNYEKYSKNAKVVKFVPASGAATRMFKDLYEFLDSKDTIDKYPKANQVYQNLSKFAFYELLKTKLQEKNIDIDSASPETIIDFILNDGLYYGSLPKALLLFHKYADESRTALEEHLVEAAMYAVSKNNKAYLHFTLSPEHIERFFALLKEKVNKYEKQFNISYEIDYSIQDPSTDTIAVDLDNKPFRDKNGKILFRPGGHGALIHNLNSIDADLIFIKNIDNVTIDKLKNDTVIYKKALAGFLIKLQKNIFEYQKAFDNNTITEILLNDIKNFFKQYFYLNIDTYSKEEIRKLIFRPIRVCGMVKNEGEPGGGPFWVFDNHGTSLQIIESSQIDMNDPQQLAIFKKSTHFNPVDLVCGVKDYKANKYDLTQYVDENTGFISQKSKDGQPLKALELPGLWNGAMAYWNTVFVEVPISTFTPVKTINDLLRPQHLNE